MGSAVSNGAGNQAISIDSPSRGKSKPVQRVLVNDVEAFTVKELMSKDPLQLSQNVYQKTNADRMHSLELINLNHSSEKFGKMLEKLLKLETD